MAYYIGMDAGGTKTEAAQQHVQGGFPVVMSGGMLTAYPQYAKWMEQKTSSQVRTQFMEDYRQWQASQPE